MKRLATLLTAGVFMGVILTLLAMNPFSPSLQVGSAQAPSGPAQSDHALLGPGDDSIYCGVGHKAEPYTLNVSAAGGTAGGTLTIQFGDGDTIAFQIPANASFSTTQALGGVPGVDNVVKITASSSVAMASVQANAGATDPFTEDGELDNFCLTKPGDPGTVPF